MKTLDLVIPCYNEADNIVPFYEEASRAAAAMADCRVSYIFVNDGSSDGTQAQIRALAALHPEVHYISFSRNFGKEAAMYAGLLHSSGDLVAVMDADLQHPPALLPAMAAGIEEGYDCCAARRLDREGEGWLRRSLSSLYYRISNSLTDIRLEQNAVDFRMMTRQMVNAVLKLSESERFSKGIFAWVGFETKWIPYENIERQAGKSKWSLRSLARYALDGITSFSVKPLRAVRNMGILLCAGSLIYILAVLIKVLIRGVDVPGYTSTLCVLLFLGGVLELSMGIVGEYVAQIYIEATDRPLFLIKETDIPREDDPS